MRLASAVGPVAAGARGAHSRGLAIGLGTGLSVGACVQRGDGGHTTEGAEVPIMAWVHTGNPGRVRECMQWMQ